MLMTWSVVRQITTSASLPSLARFGRRSSEELGVYYLSCLCMVSSSGTGLCLSDCLKLQDSLKTGVLVCVVAIPHFVKLCCCWSFCCPKCWCLRPGLYIQEWLFVSFLVYSDSMSLELSKVFWTLIVLQKIHIMLFLFFFSCLCSHLISINHFEKIGS